MKPPRSAENELILGLVSISDRASRGIYDDKGIPTLEAWCKKAITTPIKVHKRLIPDERFDIEKTLRELVDIIGCDLILTTGGTGPSRRDVTPEATLAVATREMPGFGEQMRAISGHFVPTAILSRQVGVLRETPDHAALIINLPGQPKAIAETLEGLKGENGETIVNGIFAAVPYCIDLIGGPYIETDDSIVKAFRPKSALKKPLEKPNETPSESRSESHVASSLEKTGTVTESTQASNSVSSSVKSIEAPVVEKSASVAAEVAAETAAPATAVITGDSTPSEVRTTAPSEASSQKETLKAPREPAFRPEDLLSVLPRRGGSPTLAVIWLHGMGVDNTDFTPFPDEILDFGGPVCRFILPNAPMRELSGHPGYPLRAWYDFPGDRIDDREDAYGIRESAARIAALIAEIEAAGTPRNRIVLGGFSQGAAISLYAGLREASPLGGIVALSGYLPLANRLFSEVTAAGHQTPVFMAHGDFDSVVPPMMAMRSAGVIREAVPNLVWRTYPMEHELCADEMGDLATFLNHIDNAATN